MVIGGDRPLKNYPTLCPESKMTGVAIGRNFIKWPKKGNLLNFLIKCRSQMENQVNLEFNILMLFILCFIQAGFSGMFLGGFSVCYDSKLFDGYHLGIEDCENIKETNTL